MAVIGIGVDLVEIERVQRMLDERGDRMLARLFTDLEAAYAMSRSVPARHLAARLAAKEAAFKALAGSDDARIIGWRELEVVSRNGNSPLLRMHGRAEERAASLGVTRVHLSVTHSDSAAAAMVVLEID